MDLSAVTIQTKLLFLVYRDHAGLPIPVLQNSTDKQCSICQEATGAYSYNAPHHCRLTPFHAKGRQHAFTGQPWYRPSTHRNQRQMSLCHAGWGSTCSWVFSVSQCKCWAWCSCRVSCSWCWACLLLACAPSSSPRRSVHLPQNLSCVQY